MQAQACGRADRAPGPCGAGEEVAWRHSLTGRLVRVYLKGPLLLLCLRHGLRGVPNHDGVVRGAGEAFAVGAERHARDARARDAAGVPSEGQDLLAAGCVPQLHRVIRRRAGQAFAVGTEDHALDGAGVPLQGQDHLAARHVPQFQFDNRISNPQTPRSLLE